MRETGMVLALLFLFGAIGAAQAVAWGTLLEVGYALMLEAAWVGIPAEFVYFGTLFVCLRRNGQPVPGWYWRSFEHHHSLTKGQRWWVLPPFYLGALSFLMIVLGIAIVFLSVLAAVLSLR